MVPPSYSQTRSKMANDIGLGRLRAKVPTPAVEPATMVASVPKGRERNVADDSGTTSMQAA